MLVSIMHALSMRFDIGRSPLVTFGLLALVSSGCQKPQSQTPPAPLVVEGTRSPAIGTTTSPRLTRGGGRAILSWLETANFRTTLKFSERTAEGWSEPQAVVSAQDIVVNPADVPSVLALEDGTLVAHWNQQYDDDDEEAYSLSVSWSADGGRTWAPAVRPHHDSTKTQHGFGTLFQIPGGGVGVVWLDGRAIVRGATARGAPESANNMSLRAAVFDLNRRQLNEVEVDSRVCDCCQTAVAETATGAVLAYRGRSADEVRDISVVHLTNGTWSAPHTVHNDNWTINGCPVNGPAVDANPVRIAVAWFTAASGEGQSLVAFSDDGGKTFAAPIRVDDGQVQGHVDIALLPDGSAAVSWTSADNGNAFKVRRVAPTGLRSEAVTIAQVGRAEYPRLTRGRDEILFAWTETEGGHSRVHTARAPIAGVEATR